MFPRLLLCTALASAAAAADTYTDLRLQLGSYPGFDQVSYESPDGSTTSPDYDIEDSSGFDIELLASHGFASPGPIQGFIQVGGALRGFDGTDEVGWDHEVGVLAVEIGGGLAWRPNDRFTLEIGPLLTVGSLHAREESGTAESEGDGSYVAIDLRIGAWASFGALQTGVVLGAGGHAGTAEHDAHPGFADASVDSEYSGGGAFLLVGLGVRL